jgi:hypothetical protein
MKRIEVRSEFDTFALPQQLKMPSA